MAHTDGGHTVGAHEQAQAGTQGADSETHPIGKARQRAGYDMPAQCELPLSMAARRRKRKNSLRRTASLAASSVGKAALPCTVVACVQPNQEVEQAQTSELSKGKTYSAQAPCLAVDARRAVPDGELRA